MHVFVKQSGNNPIESVEFQTIKGQHYAFIRVSAQADVAGVSAWLNSAPANHQLLSSTPAGNGALLVTRGSAPEAVLATLANHGAPLAPPAPEKKAFNPWSWRGYTSIVGQSLQIASSWKGSGSAADRGAIFGFAALNLVANFINILFGAQKKSDPHHLRILKQQVNDELAPFVNDDTLPNPDHHVLPNHSPEAPGAGLAGFLQKHSVSFGEIGLRTLGAISLSFPVTRWKAGWNMLRETGSFSKTVGAIRNPNAVTFGAGLITILGKFTAFSATEPDPHNPEPPSMLDTFRQKVAFRLSSIIEGYAAGWMTLDRFTKQKITIGGKEMPDYLGGAGNAVFVGGYGIRLAAPYGSREVNMPELYAHAAQGLSKVSAADLPGATAQVALQLKTQLRDKPIALADMYAGIAQQLETKHHLHLMPADKQAPPSQTAQVHSSTPSPRIEASHASHPERMAQQPGQTLVSA